MPQFQQIIAETTIYEFKEMVEKSKPKSWLKSVSAFANGMGGSIFFGIDDTGIIVGLDDIQHHCEFISEQIKVKIDPAPDFLLLTHEDDEKQYIEVKVSSGILTPYYYYSDGNRIAYVRIGNESVIATSIQLNNLVLKGRNIDYAERAVFEALVNAIIHRDYSIVGSEVHIDMYDNRLSISSPGGMFDGTLIQNRNIDEVPSTRRNPILADIFAQLNYMEKRGSGLRKICKESANLFGYAEKNQPKFYSGATVFFTEIPNNNYSNDELNDELNGELNDELNKGQAKVFHFIITNSNCTAGYISERLQMPFGTVDRHIRILLKNKYIERRGSKKNGGYWALKNKNNDE